VCVPVSALRNSAANASRRIVSRLAQLDRGLCLAKAGDGRQQLVLGAPALNQLLLGR
jgi:hypothetical protein